MSDDVTTAREVIGQRCRDLRKAAGLTQEALSLALGVRRASIVSLEAGRHVNVSTVALVGLHCAGDALAALSAPPADLTPLPTLLAGVPDVLLLAEVARRMGGSDAG